MSVKHRTVPVLPFLLLAGLLACDAGAPDKPEDEPAVPRCGPASGVVAEVIDGDTIVLASGEKVRYLMIDTPEITNGKSECFGAEARTFNQEYVLGQDVELTYDVECTDKYGRLLAYVEAPDGEVNTLLVSRGFACAYHLPPNGDDRAVEFRDLQASAELSRAGMWAMCVDPCG
jgi:micrococcal nuclease